MQRRFGKGRGISPHAILRFPHSSALKTFGTQYSDEFVEADTFAFFRNLMALAILPLFAVAKATKQLEDPIGDLPAVNPQTVIQRRCESIMSDLLQKHDKELYRWLETKHQVPQVFLLRWIRLLFCREFSLEQSLEIWTAIFDDAFQHGIASLPLTDYFAIAMMQHIRDELLRADQSGCMKLLMHYPCQQNVAPLIVRAHFADSDVALSREFNGY